MLLLLPPSESKRTGGEPGSSLRLDALRYPELTPQRRATLAAVDDACRAGLDAAVNAFRLGPRQHGGHATNAAVASSAVMPAVDRYTGVLFDALDAGTLGEDARGWLREHALVHSAILGPVGALDPIPDYRLSHNARLPGMRLGSLWAGAVTAALEAHDDLILDARSEAYAALGPRPVRERSVYLRVVTDADGHTRALNHFNKKAKGELARALAATRALPVNVAELCDWGAGNGFVLRPRGDELLLVV